MVHPVQRRVKEAFLKNSAGLPCEPLRPQKILTDRPKHAISTGGTGFLQSVPGLSSEGDPSGLVDLLWRNCTIEDGCPGLHSMACR